MLGRQLFISSENKCFNITQEANTEKEEVTLLEVNKVDWPRTQPKTIRYFALTLSTIQLITMKIKSHWKMCMSFNPWKYSGFYVLHDYMISIKRTMRFVYTAFQNTR